MLQPIDSLAKADSLNLSRLLAEVKVHETSSNFCQYLGQPDTIVTLFALFVSIVAIYFSVRYNRKTFRLTEEHNMLSHKPLFTSYFSKDLGNGNILIKLANNGLGPAFIIKVKYKYSNYSSNDLFELIKKLDNSEIPFGFTINEPYSRKIENHWIAEKTDMILLKTTVVVDDDYIEKFMSILGNITISVFYKDIYKEEDNFSEKFIVE